MNLGLGVTKEQVEELEAHTEDIDYELAAEYEVNTNTVLRTFDILQRDEIIYPKRGICVFVSPGARHKIRIARKQEFRKHELPEFLRRLRLLGMTIDDVVKAWEERQDTKG